MGSNVRAELAIVSGVLLAVWLTGFATQQRISRAHGQGWDGVHYYAVAEQLSRGEIPEANAPFVYRVGTPFLASLLPGDDLLRNFAIVNWVACLLAVALLLVWLRPYVADWRVRSLLAVLFIIPWHAPLRFVHFYPA